MMSTVSSRFWAIPARSSGSFTELTIFTFWTFVKKTLCLSVGLLVFGLLYFFAISGNSVDSSSELTLISSGVFSFSSP